VNQTKLESLLEQILNVGSGFIIAFAVWGYIVRPLIHAGYLSIEHTLIITIIFTFISVVRGFIWRRFFNAGIHKWVHSMVKKTFNKTYYVKMQ